MLKIKCEEEGKKNMDIRRINKMRSKNTLFEIQVKGW